MNFYKKVVPYVIGSGIIASGCAGGHFVSSVWDNSYEVGVVRYHDDDKLYVGPVTDSDVNRLIDLSDVKNTPEYNIYKRISVGDTLLYHNPNHGVDVDLLNSDGVAMMCVNGMNVFAIPSVNRINQLRNNIKQKTR